MDNLICFLLACQFKDVMTSSEIFFGKHTSLVVLLNNFDATLGPHKKNAPEDAFIVGQNLVVASHLQFP